MFIHSSLKLSLCLSLIIVVSFFHNDMSRIINDRVDNNMKPRYFVVFSRTALAPPKLYQRQLYAIKKCQECPSYDLKSFFTEEEAKQFYHAKMSEGLTSKRANIYEMLKKNLELDTKIGKKGTDPSARTDQPSHLSSVLSDTKRQQRLKWVCGVLQQNKVFKKANFYYTPASLQTNLQYEGYFDGSCLGNPGQAGIGYIIREADRETNLIARSEYIGKKTNNRAEMAAMILLISDAYCNGVKNLKVFGDSQLSINFMNGDYRAKNVSMLDYFTAAKTISQRFARITFQHIERTYNFEADKLAREGALRRKSG